MAERDDDPLDVDLEEIGLPEELEGELLKLRNTRERLGPEDWNQLMFWRRLHEKVTWLFGSIPLLIFISLLGVLGQDLVIQPFHREHPSKWTIGDKIYIGDRIYVAAWITAVTATIIGIVGRLVAAAMLRRTAGRVELPDMNREDVLDQIEGAAFIEEAKQFEQETKQEEHEQALFDEQLHAGPVWWREELSGAHLIWWIALALVLAAPSYLESLAGVIIPACLGVVFSGIIFKVLIGWVGYFRVADCPQTKLAILRYYRWWGRGIWPVIIVFFFMLLGVVIAETLPT